VPELPGAYDLSGRVAAVTGGAGMLGREHAIALAETGARVALLDLPGMRLDDAARDLNAQPIGCDLTNADSVRGARDLLIERVGRIDVLVNNAANDPKVGGEEGARLSRLENFPDEQWEADIAVGLTGAYRSAREFGSWMADNGGGVILNIASDLGVIAPDQRLYRDPSLPPDAQPVKPVTYSVVKHGLVGLTRYLATYWADRGVRCNALSPGGVRVDQPEDFVERLVDHIPLGRMANRDEYHAAIQFLCSDASSYMNGHNLVMDGGRSVW
jgi:NAD(P)-dependent dehydrogenase (short-subunit alcohol dehydrogenase family)